MVLNIPVKDWSNQRVWIVGASSGIGAALAQYLLSRGAQVILSARRTELLQKVVAEIGGESVSAHIVPFDVFDAVAWQGAHQHIQEQLSGLDLLLFCAADYRVERIWEVDAATACRTLEINLGSVYKALQAVLPAMIEKKVGGIGIIASVAGYVGLPNASVYGPSKAALINLAEILYCDLHPKGINVYLICPGFVDTNLTKKNTFAMPALVTPQQAAFEIVHGIEKGRFEIHFPFRFTFFMKLLQLLPYWIRLFFLRQLVK